MESVEAKRYRTIPNWYVDLVYENRLFLARLLRPIMLLQSKVINHKPVGVWVEEI